MKCWILNKPWNTQGLEDYSITRFKEQAEKDNVNLEIIDPDEIELVVDRNVRKGITLRGQEVSLPDVVLPRTGARTTYFSFAVIRHLERLGIPCFNTSAAIEAVKDKLYTQQIMAQAGLPIPKTMLAKFPVDVHTVEKQLGFPVVVKPLYGAQGKGVYLVDDAASLNDMMQLIEVTDDKANIIMQNFVSTSRGKDLRVFVVGGRPVACMMRKNSGDGFKANYSQGGTVENHEITPEIEWLATEACRATGLDIAGVDLLFDEDSHFKICEVNSAPGFKGIESVCEIDIAREIFHFLHIRLGLV
ncbi:RimK family alpha-L-glutamate ligase [Myxococcota bacterium]|nr:RimK family alpha-L-glutamate ligase [Myxococcota bacterium]MBU1380226.1 RimK family alpha-L-glutamate ligase [Myxococcota bacterium]MBU1499092.1 RimK family alpha-L-glutamate ligase [Myxococcota bacterium]